MTEIHHRSAVELSALLRSREISSREVVDHFISRIESVNPMLNAVVIERFGEARNEADAADRAIADGAARGRIHGVPFTVKECFDLVGTPSTLGLESRRNDVPPANDRYIEHLMGEGGIVLGKTNVPQLLIFIESVNRVYGRTNNPHNPEFTCGGSSGGEGAIVGAGASPVGIGSDIGGSVRFPAAFCGACSIKPTMWRTPDLTRYGDSILTGPINSVTGVIANFAEDLELFLSLINEPANVPEPLRPSEEIDIARLRIGYYENDGLFEPADSVRRAVREAVATLRSEGAGVVRFEPPSFRLAEEIFYRILTVDGGKTFTDVLGDEKALPQLRDLFMILQAGPLTRSAVGRIAAAFGQGSLARMVGYFGGSGEKFLTEWARRQDEYRNEFLRSMTDQGIDAIIGPVSALPAFLHDSTDRVGLGGTYTLLHNLLGFPAGVARVTSVLPEETVPKRSAIDLRDRAAANAERRSAGLPVAVQIGARPWREIIVLRLIGVLHRRSSEQ